MHRAQEMDYNEGSQTRQTRTEDRQANQGRQATEASSRTTALALQQQLSSTREPFLLEDLWELNKGDGEIAQLEKERAASIGRMRRIHTALKGEVSITGVFSYMVQFFASTK